MQGLPNLIWFNQSNIRKMCESTYQIYCLSEMPTSTDFTDFTIGGDQRISPDAVAITHLGPRDSSRSGTLRRTFGQHAIVHHAKGLHGLRKCNLTRFWVWNNHESSSIHVLFAFQYFVFFTVSTEAFAHIYVYVRLWYDMRTINSTAFATQIGIYSQNATPPDRNPVQRLVMLEANLWWSMAWRWPQHPLPSFC